MPGSVYRSALEEMGVNIQDMLGGFCQKKGGRKVSVQEGRRILIPSWGQSSFEWDEVPPLGFRAVEETGFIS